MAFAHSSPLSLCIFKDCLIKETLVNKLDVLEFYLHLLGSVEFNVLEKTHPTLYFQTPVYFKVFLCNLSCECCLVYVKDSMTWQDLCWSKPTEIKALLTLTGGASFVGNVGESDSMGCTWDWVRGLESISMSWRRTAQKTVPYPIVTAPSRNAMPAHSFVIFFFSVTTGKLNQHQRLIPVELWCVFLINHFLGILHLLQKFLLWMKLLGQKIKALLNRIFSIQDK